MISRNCKSALNKPYVFFILILPSLFLGCVNTDLKEEARIKSDEIIKHLADTSSYAYFPRKHFPRDQMIATLHDLRVNCDYENRKGRFIDYFYESKPGADRVSFIYEYYLNCDSIRFILGFKLDAEPELVWFKLEPIEVENKMIIYKSKQLMNADRP